MFFEKRFSCDLIVTSNLSFVFSYHREHPLAEKVTTTRRGETTSTGTVTVKSRDGRRVGFVALCQPYRAYQSIPVTLSHVHSDVRAFQSREYTATEAGWGRTCERNPRTLAGRNVDKILRSVFSDTRIRRPSPPSPPLSPWFAWSTLAIAIAASARTL